MHSTLRHWAIVGFIFLTMVFMLPAPLLAEEGAEQILATIGSEQITLADFDQELAKLPPQYQQMATDPAIKKEFLDTLVTQYVIYQEGLQQKLLEKDLIREKIEDFSKKLVVAYLLDQEVNKKVQEISSDELHTYYEQHLNQFQQPQQVKARHILVANREEAETILSHLQQGEDFSSLAKAHSTCPSKARGGDLGFFTSDQMVKEFSDAAFSLEPGEISPVVKTQFGYHIILVDEKKAAAQQSFDDVKEALTEKMRAERKNEYFANYVAALKKQHNVKMFPERLQDNK
ncbi:MAG: peptidylprolyl isomerase [Deltaproteobacteria bacterium]|nr:peptidylprolyl isomerase [Candidatus Anaeroferrophillus wilburensis]MBN2890129.1 peptidylprolyl isomerase [Deltaproteobacteria bacterium]